MFHWLWLGHFCLMEGKLSHPSCCEGEQRGTQKMGIVEWQMGIGSGGCRRGFAASPKAFFNSWRFLLNTWLQAGSTAVRHSCLICSQRCRAVFYWRWNDLAGKLHGLTHSLLEHLSKDAYYSLLVPHVRQAIMPLLTALKQREGFYLIQSDPFSPPMYWIIGFH